MTKLGVGVVYKLLSFILKDTINQITLHGHILTKLNFKNNSLSIGDIFIRQRAITLHKSMKMQIIYK